MLANIFRSYDIRGVYGQDIDERLFERIGNAFACHVQKDVLVARDARVSSEKLLVAFISGALDAGKNVINIGQAPLSAAMHWAVSQGFEFAYVTASHLPKEWNGVKFYHPDGTGFLENENYSIRDAVLSNEYVTVVRGVPVREDNKYVLDFYVSDLAVKIGVSEKKTKIIIDCGNGAAGMIARQLFEKAGFRVDVIFEEPDGNFPNRMSDPVEDPLDELKRRVGKYDFGLAYDGDGDRFVVVAKDGKKLASEQIAYTVLSELLKHAKGPVVANVECSMLLEEIARKFNTNVIRSRVGHTFLMDAVIKNRAVYGVEASGHYVIPMLTNFDDALAVSLYFSYAVEQLGPLEKIISEIPHYSFERIDFECSDEKKFAAMDKIKRRLEKEHDVHAIDGVRISFPDAWLLIRPSNTSPYIRLTIEAKTKEKFDELKEKFVPIVREETENI